MFSCCVSLISLPDLSKWNTENLRDIYHMFEQCISLSSFPDITKWDIQVDNDIYELNEMCISNLCIIKS